MVCKLVALSSGPPSFSMLQLGGPGDEANARRMVCIDKDNVNNVKLMWIMINLELGCFV